LDAALQQAGRHPLAHPIIFKEYRRALVRKFPIGVFYVVQQDTIVVDAVLDLRADPRRNRERL